eukprot:gb/GECG01003886.1/.p1 GENE.gb/GECG01003886.1/~~gb/GECG01003886.1/.p1  ORF type:complete len:578 (+),score=86.32 gb/GECG01003886.1/:1-1734(+)
MALNRKKRKKTRQEEEQDRRLHEAYIALDQLTRHETRETGYARIVRTAKHELTVHQVKLLLRRASEFTQFDEPTQHQYLKLLAGIMEETSHEVVQGNTFKAILNASLRCLKVPRFWDAAADTIAVLLRKAHESKEFLHVADTFCQLILRLNAKVASEQAGIATTIGRVSFYVPLFDYGELFDTLLEGLLEFLRGTTDSESLTCGYLALSNIPKSNPRVYLRAYCVSVLGAICELEENAQAVATTEYGSAAAAALECAEVWVSYALDDPEATEVSSKLSQILGWAMELVRQSKIPHLRETALYTACAIEQYLGVRPKTESEDSDLEVERIPAKQDLDLNFGNADISPDVSLASGNEILEGQVDKGRPDDAVGNNQTAVRPEKEDIEAATGHSENSRFTFQVKCTALNISNLASSAADTVQFGIEHAKAFCDEKKRGFTNRLPWEILLPIECLNWRDWRKLPQRTTNNYVNSLCHAMLLILRDQNTKDVAFEADPELDQHTQALASKFLSWLQQWQQVTGDVFEPFSPSARKHLYEMLLLFSGMGAGKDCNESGSVWTGVRQRAAALLVNYNCDTSAAI